MGHEDQPVNEQNENIEHRKPAAPMETGQRTLGTLFLNTCMHTYCSVFVSSFLLCCISEALLYSQSKPSGRSKDPASPVLFSLLTSVYCRICWLAVLLEACFLFSDVHRWLNCTEVFISLRFRNKLKPKNKLHRHLLPRSRLSRRHLQAQSTRFAIIESLSVPDFWS